MVKNMRRKNKALVATSPLSEIPLVIEAFEPVSAAKKLSGEGWGPRSNPSDGAAFPPKWITGV
jgi:hypothetical protein